MSSSRGPKNQSIHSKWCDPKNLSFLNSINQSKKNGAFHQSTENNKNGKKKGNGFLTKNETGFEEGCSEALDCFIWIFNTRKRSSFLSESLMHVGAVSGDSLSCASVFVYTSIHISSYPLSTYKINKEDPTRLPAETQVNPTLLHNPKYIQNPTII